MRPLVTLLLASLALTGACKGDSAAPPRATASTTARPPSATVPPALADTGTIDNLASVPAEARERLVDMVEAIETDDRAKFLQMVSMGGFGTPDLALDASQVAAELQGRTVAELALVPACRPGACRWRVAKADASFMTLAADQNGSEVGAIELRHEDDGSWGVLRATQRRPDAGGL